MNSSAQTTATGTLVSTRAIVKAVYIRDTATAGTVVFKDDGSGGTTKLTINTPARIGTSFIDLKEGIEFKTDVHVTLADVDGVTIIYR